MDCYRVRVPEGTRLTGCTAAGQRVSIVPGEYHVHRLPARFLSTGAGDALRFVGADQRGRDVLVALPWVRQEGNVLKLDGAERAR